MPAPDLAPVAGTDFPTFLGRPWKAYSRTVVMLSYLDAHVDPRGWLEWDGDFALKTLFYGDFALRTRGPVPAPPAGSSGLGTTSSRTGAWPCSSPSASSFRLAAGSTAPACPTLRDSDSSILNALVEFSNGACSVSVSTCHICAMEY